jgi:hypothetical protein
VAFHDPDVVGHIFEFKKGLTQLLDRLRGPYPEKVLLERPNEPLRTTFALRLHHQGMRTLYPQKGKLPLKILRHVSAPMIMTHFEILMGELEERSPS